MFLSGWEDKDKKGALVLFVDFLRGRGLSVGIGMAAIRRLFRSHLEDVAGGKGSLSTRSSGGQSG